MHTQFSIPVQTICVIRVLRAYTKYTMPNYQLNPNKLIRFCYLEKSISLR